MNDTFYTLACWKVKEGNEEQFINSWKEMGNTLASIPQFSIKSKLIQSLKDPTLFYSFGPWESLEDIEETNTDPQAQKIIQKVMDLCDNFETGIYRLEDQIQL